MQLYPYARGLCLAAGLIAAVAVSGCAKDNAQVAAGSYGAGGLAAPGSAQDFAVNVGDRIFFDTDQTELSATAQETLDKQARWLAQYPRYSFTLEGHADERGTREYNFALGARRAEAAKDYLLAKGIAAARIKTISYGKERPVAVCNDISCWSQNRRVVTVLNGGQS
jgi:peptidoglycan-associated lipoprotein